MRISLPLLLMLQLFSLSGLLAALAWAARMWLWVDVIGRETRWVGW